MTTVPKHVLGVDLLKLILRAKDPFPPRFYCHSCKQKFTVPMTSTSPRPTKCTQCSSAFIEWVLPEDPHQRAARLRDAALLASLSPSPSPPSSPPPPPAPSQPEQQPPAGQKEEPMETDSAAKTAEEKTEAAKTAEEKTGAAKTAEEKTGAAKTESGGSGGEEKTAPPPPEPMEQEAVKKEDPPPPPPEEDLEEEPEEETSSGGRLSAQPMVVVSAGGDTDHPTLTMNLFPSLDEAGPRNEGRRGPIRTTMVQQKTSRSFTYLAQEYMAKIIQGGRGRRGQQLLVGLTGGAQTEASDPADFVWGARGLDSIISGLLESMSDRGPPPAKKDKVDAIPMVEATQEIVDENVDGCTVCKDGFKVEDKLRKLPCKHLFHETCIIPWLKLHDTCPTCRFHVNADKDKPARETP